MENNGFKLWRMIFNLLVFLAFIVLVCVMFYKGIDFVYIICTLLVSLLPLSTVIKEYKKKTG